MDQLLLNAYADPRFRATLGVIRDAEGTSRYGDPYRVAGGGKATLSQLQTPEFKMWGFKDKTGKQDQSSATGAYQFLRSTWGGLANKYGFTDFSPRSQDLAALALLKDAGAFPYIQRGDYLGALHQARKIWASLPGAGYNQKERDRNFLVKSIEKHLGQPLKMHEQTYDVAQAVQPQGQEQTAVQRGGISPQQIVTGDDPYAKLFNVDIAPQQQVAMQQPIRIETGQLTPHQVIDFSSALWE